MTSLITFVYLNEQMLGVIKNYNGVMVFFSFVTVYY